jgi:hypothetical protein
VVHQHVFCLDAPASTNSPTKIIGPDNPMCSREHKGTYAESSVRPLRRRAARIDRPARVRIRRRNPWTFARRRLFG